MEHTRRSGYIRASRQRHSDVGLDIKAMRTQKQAVSTKHLSNSRTIFLKLLEVVRSLDVKERDRLVAERDYEELDLMIINALMGTR